MPQATADNAWLTYRDGKKPLIYVETYSQYIQSAHVYLNGVGREDLLPLLSLRYAKETHASHGKAPSWMLHRKENIVRLGHIATFFPEGNVAYIRQRNGHFVGALAQYLMHKCGWQVYAYRQEVPQQRAVNAEELAVPMHAWFKASPSR